MITETKKESPAERPPATVAAPYCSIFIPAAVFAGVVATIRLMGAGLL